MLACPRTSLDARPDEYQTGCEPRPLRQGTNACGRGGRNRIGHRHLEIRCSRDYHYKCVTSSAGGAAFRQLVSDARTPVETLPGWLLLLALFAVVGLTTAVYILILLAKPGEIHDFRQNIRDFFSGRLPPEQITAAFTLAFLMVLGFVSTGAVIQLSSEGMRRLTGGKGESSATVIVVCPHRTPEGEVRSRGLGPRHVADKHGAIATVEPSRMVVGLETELKITVAPEEPDRLAVGDCPAVQAARERTRNVLALFDPSAEQTQIAQPTIEAVKSIAKSIKNTSDGSDAVPMTQRIGTIIQLNEVLEPSVWQARKRTISALTFLPDAEEK